MNNDTLMNKFGYSEMYEWAEGAPVMQDNDSFFGRFVQFDPKSPDKVVLPKDNLDNLVGITTINSVEDSDDPTWWNSAYLQNEYGDIYLTKETLAVGNKEYDQLNEISYIHTMPWSHYIPIPTKEYQQGKQYVPRSQRPEWIRVNLLGKAIVKDNGKCKPGQWCTPIASPLTDQAGTVKPCGKTGKLKYYVLERVSDHTVLILNK